MATNMSSEQLKMNTHANLDTKQPRHVQKTLLNVHTRSHKDNPASIMHIMTLHSCPKRSTFPHCDFNYGLVVRNMKKTLFFLFSAFTMRLPVWGSTFCEMLPVPRPTIRKSFSPLKAQRCGGSCIVGCERRGAFQCAPQTQSGGQREATLSMFV